MEKALDQISKNVAHFKVVVNVPLEEQAAGFRIDLRRGLVKFENVQGTVAQEGASLDKASLAPGLPHVELEFGYELRPGYENDVTSDLRYSSVWVRSTVNGKTTVQQAQGLAAGVAPVLKQRPDLEFVFDVNGTRTARSSTRPRRRPPRTSLRSSNRAREPWSRSAGRSP